MNPATWKVSFIIDKLRMRHLELLYKENIKSSPILLSSIPTHNIISYFHCDIRLLIWQKNRATIETVIVVEIGFIYGNIIFNVAKVQSPTIVGTFTILECWILEIQRIWINNFDYSSLGWRWVSKDTVNDLDFVAIFHVYGPAVVCLVALSVSLI